MTVGASITLGLWLLGMLVWHFRLRTALAPTPFSNASKDQQLDDASKVSIVVPARNEAHNLPALLASLNQLSPAPQEIIVVDDESEDGTAAIARSHGATVIAAPPRPGDWNGKPWAWWRRDDSSSVAPGDGGSTVF